MMGIVMPNGGQFEKDIRERLESVTLVLLLPLFFAYTGLRTSIGLLNNGQRWLLCGLIVITAVGSKLLVSALMVRASGMPWRESLAHRRSRQHRFHLPTNRTSKLRIPV